MLDNTYGITLAVNPLVNTCYFTMDEAADNIDELDMLGRKFIKIFPGSLQVSLNNDTKQLSIAANSKDVFEQVCALVKGRGAK